jgi:Lrp/AsnC family leucine-responsive transcriptional regulator
VLRVVAPTIPAIEELLDEFLLYGQTNTSIVVSTPVPRRSPPMDRAQASS